MYFSQFPKIEYTINGRTEEIVDLFRKVLINKNSNHSLYDEIVVTDNDTIESLAEKYYGDANMSWVIAVMNDIVNPIDEFPKSTELLNYMFETKYNGTIFYFEENVDLQEGDILMGVTSGVSINTLPQDITSTNLITDKFCFVNSYNNEFRYARVTNLNGSYLQTNSLIGLRKINNKLNIIEFTKQLTSGGQIQSACILPIKKIDTYLNSPVYMYNTADNSILSPYRKFSSSALIDDFVKLNANGTFAHATDDNAFRQSILFKVLMSDLSVTNVSHLKLIDDIKAKNENFRKIKIIQSKVFPSFINTFNELMATSDIRSRLISTKV